MQDMFCNCQQFIHLFSAISNSFFYVSNEFKGKLELMFPDIKGLNPFYLFTAFSLSTISKLQFTLSPCSSITSKVCFPLAGNTDS